MTGHTVLAVPVPVLDAVVRERTAFYDASFVSTDPDFVHAHITVLAPWVTEPTQRDLEVVGDLAATVEPVEIVLEEVVEFRGGVIHLRPEPDEPFRKLTAALTAAFPDFLPYGGAFPDPVPHLTLDHPAGGVRRADVEERMRDHLPVTFRMDRLDLQWWANDDCRLLHRWHLGSTGSGA
ncbi:2'-5' RNA ligase family protein [Nocardioides sp. Kera G14]|uniref:2'-5' RNA ligase family protein n=1 Tax=Nocardioides sp. Kera G14 TaxID=2884264 RepID=UPI001D10AE1C|nr:2'-5' RNA ligase family protein [Nocardioides sp. Kera G14]UDY24895.1 2'-5' RNA ligase family protein [Nocardioides sp. Kera G14]